MHSPTFSRGSKIHLMMPKKPKKKMSIFNKALKTFSQGNVSSLGSTTSDSENVHKLKARSKKRLSSTKSMKKSSKGVIKRRNKIIVVKNHISIKKRSET